MVCKPSDFRGVFHFYLAGASLGRYTTVRFCMNGGGDMPTLFDSVNTLSGVGPVRASQLAALGIYTLYDLISYFPRDYEDRTKLVRIAELEPDRPACFEAMVVSQPRTSYIRKGMELLQAGHTVSETAGLCGFNQVSNFIHAFKSVAGCTPLQFVKHRP